MIPVYLKIQNFLSFEDQEYYFPENKAYLIQGVNNSKDSQQSNGSGKSSLQSALEYSLTKTTSRKCRDIKLIRRGEKQACIELVLSCSIRKEELRIIRTIPLKGSTTCELFLKNEKVQVATVQDADDFILGWISIEKEDLQNYFIINRERYTSFFSSSNTKKLALLSRFSNTKPIDKMVENVIKDVEEKDLEVIEFEKDILKVQSKIELIQEQITEEENRDIDKEIKEEVEKLEDKVWDKLEDIKLNNSISLKNEKSILEKEAVLTDLNTELGKVSENVKSLKEATLKDDIKVKRDEVNEQETLIDDLTQIKNDLSEEINKINKEVSSIETKLAGTITCPKCSHEFVLGKGSDLEQLQAEVDKLKKSRKLIENGDLKETEEVEKEIKESLSSIKSELNKLKTKDGENESAILKLQTKLNSITENVNKTKHDITSLKQSNESLKNKNEQIEESIILLKEKIKQVEEKQQDSTIIEGLQDNLHDYKQSLGKVEKQIQDKQDEVFEIKQWETNFKRFKSHLAQKSLLTIQVKINEQLKLMKCDLRIKLEGFKEKADGTLKEEITPQIIDNGEIVEFSALSGGERVRVDFATILVLQEIINSTHKYGGLNLLFVDEITEGVDPLGLSLLMKSMPKNKSIFVITHIQMDSLYEDILTIENNNGISTIR